jgi:RNA polymerase sigma-32 factor
MKLANMPGISDGAVISLDEEKTLTAQYKVQPTKQLAEKIIQGNIKYVAKIAHQFSRKYHNFHFEDFFQEGMIGMKIALDKFDPEKIYIYPHARFTTYAKHWIIAHMQQFVIRNWSQVSSNSLTMRQRFFGKFDKAEYDSLAKESRLPLPDISLNSPINSNSNDASSTEKGDAFADENPHPEESYSTLEFDHELKKAFDELVANFNERDQFIIRHRFLTDEPMTLAEIGDKYGVSRERVRQLEALAMERLIKMVKNSAEMEDFVEDMVA